MPSKKVILIIILLSLYWTEFLAMAANPMMPQVSHPHTAPHPHHDINITSFPANAWIYFDGKNSSLKTPQYFYPIELPGVLNIKVFKKNFTNRSVNVTVNSSLRDVNFYLNNRTALLTYKSGVIAKCKAVNSS